MAKMSTRRLRTAAPLLVLIALCVLVAVANPNFLDLRNLIRIANSAAVPLTLAMGTRCTVQGVVLRIDDNAFIVKIEKGIKGYDVIREQVFVSKHFPDWKPQPT